MWPSCTKIQESEFTDSEPSLEVAELLKEISKSLEDNSATSRSLSIGLEIEFFILDTHNRPANLHLSQEFIKIQSLSRGWRRSHDTANTELTYSGASREKANGRYTKLKYEYAPHVLEVAFAYSTDLHTLVQDVRETLEDLQETAQKLGCIAKFIGFLNPCETIDIVPSTNKIKNLNLSRVNYLLNQGVNPSAEISMFTSYMAGTQIHIGGLDWFPNAYVLENLYKFESINPLLGTQLLLGDSQLSKEYLERRTRLYRECFPNMTLNGFPNLESWTVHNWALAMLNGPIAASADARLQGAPYFSLPKDSRPEIRKVMPFLRDLQFYKPRFFGTIESRFEPSAGDADRVAALLSWRVGLSVLSVLNISEKVKFQVIRSNWQKRSLEPESISDSEGLHLIDLVIAALRTRGLNEEKYLEDRLCRLKR